MIIPDLLPFWSLRLLCQHPLPGPAPRMSLLSLFHPSTARGAASNNFLLGENITRVSIEVEGRTAFSKDTITRLFSPYQSLALLHLSRSAKLVGKYSLVSPTSAPYTITPGCNTHRHNCHCFSEILLHELSLPGYTISTYSPIRVALTP